MGRGHFKLIGNRVVLIFFCKVASRRDQLPSMKLIGFSSQGLKIPYCVQLLCISCTVGCMEKLSSTYHDFSTSLENPISFMIGI